MWGIAGGESGMGETYVPHWSSVVGFGDVVHAFTVPAEEENFVVSVGSGGSVQAGDDVCKNLPLRFRLRTGGRLGKGFEAEIRGRLCGVD